MDKEMALKLSEDLIDNKKKLRHEAKKIANKKHNEILKRTTHLFMHEKGLTKMPKLKNPTHLVYAYYHNNSIMAIENLDHMFNLTHLHLQWNKITKIEGLNGLTRLKRLYLGYNCISVVENLEGLKFLQELRIEKQDTSNADGLCFEPRTAIALGGSLKILDVSENRIADISWIKLLRKLETLIAKKNRIENYEVTADYLCALTALTDANFIGNPMARKHRYRETIIARCAQLHSAADITYTFRPRSQWPKPRTTPLPPETSPPPLEPPPENPAAPLKGILKKPMHIGFLDQVNV